MSCGEPRNGAARREWRRLPPWGAPRCTPCQRSGLVRITEDGKDAAVGVLKVTRSGLGAVSRSGRLRPRSRSSRLEPPPSFYPLPLLGLPPGDHHLVAFRGPMDAHLRRPAHPVQQQRNPAQAAGDPKQPGDQIRHSGQCPALITSAVCGRTGLQFGFQPGALFLIEPAGPSGRSLGGHRRNSTDFPGPMSAAGRHRRDA